LNIHHEDALMKMFMYSLEGDARVWYRSLPASNISSLREFHAAFNEQCKRYFPAELLLVDCCEQCKSGYYSQEIDYSSSTDEEDDYIKEEEEDSLSVISSSKSVLQQEYFQHSDLEIHNNDTLDAFGINLNVSNSSDYDTNVVPNLFEDQLLTEEILVEDHTVDEKEKPTVANVFDVVSYVSYGQNSYDDQATYIRSFFQYDREVEVLGFQSSQKFSNQPLFDEYDDDLEVLDPDVDDMTNSNQQIHEGIQSIIHEESSRCMIVMHLKAAWKMRINLLILMMIMLF
jgi:hypothetical protein